MWCRVRLISFAAHEKMLMLLHAWRLTRSIRIQHAFPFLWDLWWAGLWEHKSSHSAPGCTLLSSSVPCRRRRKKENAAKDFQVCHLPENKQDPQADLLIARLHTEEDEVCRSAGETPLQIGLASYLFRLCVVVIQRLHSVLKQCPFNLETASGWTKHSLNSDYMQHRERQHSGEFKQKWFFSSKENLLKVRIRYCIWYNKYAVREVCPVTLLSSSEGNLVWNLQVVPSL